mgnify:CR=1 FL=1
MEERRGRKKKELQNHLIHRDLMNNFNFNLQKDKQHNIFEVLSNYDIVFDDIKRIKEQTRREKTVSFSCSRKVRQELIKYADLFSSNMLTIKKIDIINYLLNKMFDLYEDEEIIELIENNDLALKKIEEDNRISCYMEKSLLDKVLSIKLKLRAKKKYVAGFRIISFLLETGKKKFLPDIKDKIDYE